ncbi:MAG: YraN family protein [Patescibacteria group bacterium]
MTKSEKRKIGDIGENIACRFLKKNGFKIIERNYWKKWGEIDIVARKKQSWKDYILRSRAMRKIGGANKLYFIEVKTVSCENNYKSMEKIMADYLISDKIHKWKLQRLMRVFKTYLLDKHISDEIEWQFDIIIVFLNIKDKIYRVKWLKDIII